MSGVPCPTANGQRMVPSPELINRMVARMVARPELIKLLSDEFACILSNEGISSLHGGHQVDPLSLSFCITILQVHLSAGRHGLLTLTRVSAIDLVVLSVMVRLRTCHSIKYNGQPECLIHRVLNCSLMRARISFLAMVRASVRTKRN